MKVEKAKRLAQVSDLKQSHAAAVRHLALKNRMLNPDASTDRGGRFFLEKKLLAVEELGLPRGGIRTPK